MGKLKFILSGICIISLIAILLYIRYKPREFEEVLSSKGVYIKSLVEPQGSVKNFKDVFTYPIPFALCSDYEISGDFTVDKYNSFCGPYKRGAKAELVKECEIPFDLKKVTDAAKMGNDNAELKERGITEDLVLDGKLTLKGGVYYLKSLEMKGRASLTFKRPSLIVIEERVMVKDEAVLNSSEFPWILRIFAPEVVLEGEGKIYGVIFSEKVSVIEKAEIYGSVISKKFRGIEEGALHYDKVLSFDRLLVETPLVLRIWKTGEIKVKALDLYGHELRCAPISHIQTNPDVVEILDRKVKSLSYGFSEVFSHLLWRESRLEVSVTEFDPYGKIVLASTSTGAKAIETKIDDLRVEICEKPPPISEIFEEKEEEEEKLEGGPIARGIKKPKFRCLKRPKVYTDDFSHNSEGVWITLRFREDGGLEISPKRKSLDGSTGFKVEGATIIYTIDEEKMGGMKGSALALLYMGGGFEAYRIPRFRMSSLQYRIQIPELGTVILYPISGVSGIILSNDKSVADIVRGREKVRFIPIDAGEYVVRFEIFPMIYKEFMMLNGAVALELDTRKEPIF